METKKSFRANLESSKGVSLLMGVIVAMATLFVSFEWGTSDMKIEVIDKDGGIIWMDEIPITIPEPPAPPPPPPKTAVVDVIRVVEDEKVIIGDVDFSSEDTQEAPQDIIYLPPVPEEVEEVAEDYIHFNVEEMPMYPGGDSELLKFISRSIKYPVVAQENGIQGRVICGFVVNRDGSIVDAEVLRGIDPSLDREALRVVNAMPKWKPGMQRGKPVRVKYTLPIVFRLQ